MNFEGQAKRLVLEDVETIAGYLGCQVAAVQAVLAVEAAGSGFDHKGRPKMLFEPHIFWRELGAGSKRDDAAALGLAYAKWRPGSYPNDSYPRLEAAMAIDETAALRSASWGLGQVMGFNHEIAGFDTVQEFVHAMTYSEGAHLYAMARFIVSNGLQRHLRDRNWSSFAKGYNGSSYAKHGYHTKLANAYGARLSDEHYVPPPASEVELNALIGFNAPAEPKTEPVLVDDHDVQSSTGPIGAIIGLVIILAVAGAVAWFFLGG